VLPIDGFAVEWEAMAVLSDADVQSGLAQLSGWERTGDEIVKTYECASFADAIAFVVRVGFLAEQADHHPDIDVRWTKVRFALTTHDAGGLTRRDLDLAQAIEAAS
jgi:4a-hydroxytetrahydrobiopterin dehydratase